MSSFSRLAPALALAVAALAPGLSEAMPITKSVTINVYQLCDDGGLNCAATGPSGNEYFTDSTNKIWAQAGIAVNFSFQTTINSTHFLDIDDDVAGDTFGDLHALYGTMGPSATGIDMFLVKSVAGAYGEGWSGAGGLVMAMQTIMDFNGGLGRIDTLAHELGHNLGLEPTDSPNYAGSSDPGHSNNPNSLMAGGGIRNVPTTLADIKPDGLGYDQLNAYQIGVVQKSTLLNDVPEPAGLALCGLALSALALSRRRSAH